MRRLSSVLTASVFVTLTAACGSSDNKTSTAPTAVVSNAPQQTSAAMSAKAFFAIEGVDGSTGQDLSAEGAFDFDAGRGTIATDLPAIEGVQFGKVEAIVDRGTIYLKVPGLLASQIDTDWLKLNVGEATKDLTGLDLSGFSRAATGDPSNALNNLRGATNVTAVGDDRVRGELTTHYRATIDLRKAASEAPSDQREALQRANDLLGAQSVPADIWVDREGRLRRLRYTVDPSQASVPGADNVKGETTFTLELFEFGVSVDADVPPADKTADLAEIADKLLPG